MKKTLQEFYLDDADIEKLWDECIFVFDANILIDFYRYSPRTRSRFFNVLKSDKVASRIWIPYQFAFEYQKNRVNIIREQENSFQRLTNDIEKLVKNYSRNKFLGVEKLLKKPLKDLQKKSTEHPNHLNDDKVREELDNIFKKKVGKSFTPEELSEIYKDGLKRYERDVPPGYKDKQKLDDSKYGDLVGWKEIIKKAKAENKPIIFVSNDMKEDWWWIDGQYTLGPHYLLKKELWDEVGVKFHMYNSGNFLKYATRYLKVTVPNTEEAINEIRELSELVRRLDDGSRNIFTHFTTGTFTGINQADGADDDGEDDSNDEPVSV